MVVIHSKTLQHTQPSLGFFLLFKHGSFPDNKHRLQFEICRDSGTQIDRQVGREACRKEGRYAERKEGRDAGKQIGIEL